MKDYNLEDYLTLAFTPHLGSISFLKLIKAFGNPTLIINTPFAELKPFIEKHQLVYQNWLNPMIKTDYVVPTLKWLQTENCQLLTLYDEKYPIELTQVYPPPPVLYLRGNTALLDYKKFAIVGSRKATPQGLKISEETANILAQYQYTIVSGMALGIDSAAHLGALTEPGSTIAVIGTGIDRVYPKTNFKLAHEIAQKGLIISEFPLGTQAHAAHFPIRNRIIAGLSQATIVVEASLRSGSLITARLAMELGKDVMAFPGSIFSPQAKGTHKLIKEGARLIESANEIIEDFSDKSVYNEKYMQTISNTSKPPDSRNSFILDAMGSDLIHPDEIATKLNLPSEEVYSTLLSLELDGIVEISSGGRYQRIVF